MGLTQNGIRFGWMLLPQEIEKHLLKRNQTHFGQARGTVPATSPFSEHIDWAASTHEADLILEGEYDN